MKYLFIILLLCFLLPNLAQGQLYNGYNYSTKVENKKSDDGFYIGMSITKGIASLLSISYVRIEGNYVSLIARDSIQGVFSKTMNSPNLFQIVYENYENLIAVRNYGKLKSIIGDLHKFVKDTSVLVSQLGIRYHNFHFNHFPKFTVAQIEKAPSKVAEGMRTINELYAILEEWNLELGNKL